MKDVFDIRRYLFHKTRESTAEQKNAIRAVRMYAAADLRRFGFWWL